MKSCIVIGAGVAGLTIADRLSMAGVRVTVLERDPFIGGLCRRVDIDGAGVDLGPHNLRTQDSRVLEFWKDLIGNDLEARSFSARILFKNKFLNYPIKPLEVIKRLPTSVVLKSGLDLIFERARSKTFPRHVDSYRDWAVANYGRELYHAFFEPLTEKVWGLPPASIDPQFAKERLPPLSLRKTLLGLRPKGGFHREDPGASTHFYPKYGVYQFCDVLTQRIRSRGSDVITSAEVRSISEDPHFTSVSYDTGSTTHEITADFCVSTVPLQILNRVHSKLQASSIGRLQYRDLGLLYLSVPDSTRLPASFVYCAEREVPFNRISDFAECSRALLPEGKTILCIEFNMESNAAAALETQTQRVLDYIRTRNVFQLEHVFEKKIVTVSTVYPLYEKGYKDILNAVLTKATTFPRLLSIGRHGLFTHSNVDAVMGMALEASDFLLDDPYSEKAKLKYYGLLSKSKNIEANVHAN